MTTIFKCECWTKESVRKAVTAEEERLFAPWSIGRPIGWKMDTASKDVICVGYWLSEVLQSITNHDDCLTQNQFFHRRSRSETDPFTIAAELLNEVIAGTVPQDRKPHRRWG